MAGLASVTMLVLYTIEVISPQYRNAARAFPSFLSLKQLGLKFVKGIPLCSNAQENSH